MATCCKPVAGGSVSLSEAYQEYQKFCLMHGSASRYSERQFSVKLWQAVRRAFGLAKRNDIMREGHARRGFRHLEVKATADPNFGKIPDDPDERAEPLKEEAKNGISVKSTSMPPG